MQITIAKYFYICITLLASTLLHAQKKEDRFQAFFYIPKNVEPKYYNDLKLSKNLLEQVKIIDTISAIHIQSGNTDSILYYGNLLKEKITIVDNEHKFRDLYLSKSYYILGKGKLEKGLYDDAFKHHFDGYNAYSSFRKLERLLIHQNGV